MAAATQNTDKINRTLDPANFTLSACSGNMVRFLLKTFQIGYLFCWKEGSNLKENQLNTPLIVLWWMTFDWIDDICIGVDSSSTPCTPSQEFYSLDQLKRTSLLLQSTFIQIWSKAYLKCWYLNWKIFKENFSMHIWIKEVRKKDFNWSFDI